ncbi:MAG: hypothetical protein ACRBI6_09995, partial [Acidimicrobiales bacterium]
MEARRGRRPGAAQSDGPGPIELLGVDGPGRLEETSVATRPVRRGWLLGLLAAALVLIGVTVLTGGGADEEATDGPTTTASNEAASTTSVTTAAPATASAAERSELETVDSGPMLGEETGLGLAMLTSRGVTVVDLDTGRQFQIDQQMHEVFGVFDRWLVGVYQDRTLALDLVSRELVDLNETAELQWTQPSHDPAPPGQLWLSEWFSESLVLVDLATGSVAERIDLPTGWVFTSRGAVGSPQAGGVYDLTSGEPQRILDGGLVAAVGDRLLVQTCDDALDCSERWYDRSGRPLPDLVAPPAAGSPWMNPTSSDRWIVMEGPGSDGSYSQRMFDIETGRAVELGDGYLSPFGVSADGRWLISALGFGITVTDLDADRTLDLDIDGNSGVWIDDP